MEDASCVVDGPVFSGTLLPNKISRANHRVRRDRLAQSPRAVRVGWALLFLDEFVGLPTTRRVAWWGACMSA
jgi:hypothetical protein